MPLGANKAAIMGVAGTAAAGDVVLLSSQTASDSASISFTSGITSTYGEYIFRFYNIHVETDDADLVFQANAAGASGYNETMTTSCFQLYQNEAGDDPSLNYNASDDQAEGTAFQIVMYGLGDQNDENGAGELHLFNPAGTTYVKHFYSITNSLRGVADASVHLNHSSYFNITTAIDDIQFKTDTGNFSGTIKMWGVK